MNETARYIRHIQFVQDVGPWRYDKALRIAERNALAVTDVLYKCSEKARTSIQSIDDFLDYWISHGYLD